jgi:hypothetical protein
VSAGTAASHDRAHGFHIKQVSGSRHDHRSFNGKQSSIAVLGNI